MTVPNLAFNQKVGLDNFVNLLLPSCNNLVIITGNIPYEYVYDPEKVTIKRVTYRFGSSMVFRVMHKVLDQVTEALHIIRLSQNFQVVLFHAGVYFNQLPILCSRILRKRIVVYQFGGNYLLEQKLAAIGFWERIVKPMAAAFSRVNYFLTDVIVCEGGESLARWDQLEKYRNKIAWFVARDVDTNHFMIKTPIQDREKVVGYFGRLDPKKGILDFIRAIPIVAENERDVRFVIAGSGPIRQMLESEVDSLGLSEKVEFLGFIEENAIPDLLNKFKLLVIPTYDDGIPEVLKEALSCGTLVAVSPVGGIRDIVNDNVEAFLIRRNEPKEIAEAILRALNSPNMSEISLQGRQLIEKVYAKQAMTLRYALMIQQALKSS